VVCWGFCAFDAHIPPPDLENVVAVSGSACHSLALTADGKVVGWGLPERCTPPTDLENVVVVSAGGQHSGALTQDGKIMGRKK
jgi:alpha-tubulin suppressor-like RCC1 family protein